jgi:hypothetical protein
MTEKFGWTIFDSGASEALVGERLSGIENDVQRQDENAGNVSARHERRNELSAPGIDSARTYLRVAIRTHAVCNSNKGPAVGAHAPFFHGLIVAGRVRLKCFEVNLWD